MEMELFFEIPECDCRHQLPAMETYKEKVICTVTTSEGTADIEEQT